MTSSKTIEFASNGSTASGYLAVPDSGSGPGVIVLQEWWGLAPQILRVCDRLAAEGFVALAPDLYHGELAAHDEMDKASHLMTSLPMDRAARDMSGAITALLADDAVTGDQVGVVGFCMGGMLTLVLAASEGPRVAAAAPFYGAPFGDAAPAWSGLTAVVRGHAAAHDDFFPPESFAELEAELQAMEKDASFTIHPGTGHAFANEDNPLGTYDRAAADTAWAATLDLFRTHLRTR
jgi:carboxymethylenebutenolidase